VDARRLRPRALPRAWRAGGDAWLWIGVGAGARTLHAQSCDAAAGGEVRERVIETGPTAAPRCGWDEIVAEMKTRFPALPVAAQQPAAQRAALQTAEVRIRAAAGTEISGLPVEDIVVGPEGEANVTLAAPPPTGSPRPIRGI